MPFGASLYRKGKMGGRKKRKTKTDICLCISKDVLTFGGKGRKTRYI